MGQAKKMSGPSAMRVAYFIMMDRLGRNFIPNYENLSALLVGRPRGFLAVGDAGHRPLECKDLED